MVTLNILGFIKKCYDARAFIACSTLTIYTIQLNIHVLAYMYNNTIKVLTLLII